MTIYYLGARFSRDTNKSLLHFRQSHIFSIKGMYEMPKLGFHVTIVYSRKPFSYHLMPLLKTVCMTDQIHLFGKSIVMTLISDQWLQEQHNVCISAGATSDFSTYRPHITIAEGVLEMKFSGPHPEIPIEISELFYMEWTEKS